jgi:exonuclease VII large subunit
MWWVVIAIVIDTPMEYKLRHSTDDLREEYALMSARYDSLNNVLDNVVRRDENVFRKLFESNPYDLTADLEKENILAKHNADLSNFKLQNELNQNVLKAQSVLNLEGMQQQQVLNMESQMLQLEHQRETLRIQREEMQRASRLQTEQTFMGAHQANLNAVAVNNALDKGFNVFEQQAKQAAQAQMAAPQVNYMIAVNNQQAGPFNWEQLKQLVQQGQLTTQTYVWKQGMAGWDFAGNVQELQPLFASAMPQMPKF